MIQPIQTRYAGCHFRSRLEARWAVFFDALGVAWQYEAQGYELPSRLHPCSTTVNRWLPDFWLPELGLLVEVKGELTDDETWRLLDCAAAVSSPTGGCGSGPSTLVLGPVPKPSATWAPLVLHLHKGDLTASPWHGGPSKCFDDPYFVAANDCGDLGTRQTIAMIADALLRGSAALGPIFNAPRNQLRQDALESARSARFEHGASGAT